MLGLDLGTSSLKLVELKQVKNNWTLQAVGIIVNPLGSLTPGNSEQRVLLIEAIKKLISETRVSQKKVRFGLAERAVYTRIIQLPVMSDAELASAIRWEAEQHVPIPLTQVQLDWTVIEKPEKGVKEGGMKVLLVAARREELNWIVGLLADTGLELTGIETTTLGLVRALTSDQDPPTLLMQLGASSTDFSVTVAGKLALTYSIPTAGTSLTRAVEQGLGLSVSQAEEYKRSYGLEESLLEGKVRGALLPVFDSIVAEAKKVLNSFLSSHRSSKVDRVLLSGGTALLPEIATYVTSQLGVSETIIADPFYGLSLSPEAIVPQARPVYTVAVGLAKGGE